MANDKHREDFRKAMELVRSMSDEKLLERIRSHGKGEYGLAFGLPEVKINFILDFNQSSNAPVEFRWSEQYFIGTESQCTLDAANDNKYHKAA